MNGFIRKVALGGALAALAGCAEYRELVDPCWPQRYNYEARNSVHAAFNAQAANGHALDQTIWNQFFEPGTEKLTKVGEEHLKYIVRRRPGPDPHVMVQVAYDAVPRAANPKALDAKTLNERRVEVVQEYLSRISVAENCLPNGCCAQRMPVTFEVTLCDAAEPGLPSRSAPNTYVTPTRVLEDRALAVGTTPGNTYQTGTAGNPGAPLPPSPAQSQGLQQR